MKLQRTRLLSASMVLAAVPFTGSSFISSASAANTIAVTAEAPSSQAVYGLAARLPKDTDAFISFYRLSDLWDGFRKSNFLKKVMANEMLVREMEIDKLQREWENNPMLQEYGKMAGSMLGGEVMVALPAGFVDNVAAILKQLPALQAALFHARLASPGGGDPGMPKEMLPVVEAVAELNIPPFIIAMKAGAHRETLKSLIGQALNEIPSDVMSRLSKTSSEVAGGHAFDHLTVKVEKVMPEEVQAEMKRDLSRAAGSEEKGEALAKKLLAKSATLSWGWVDDYFVLSIGSDTSHLKFVTATDSVLSHPDVVVRAAQFAVKKPISFSYTSQKAFRTLNDAGGFLKSLTSLVNAAKTAAPVKLDGVIAELKALNAKADTVWPNDADANVAAMWWDGGLHFESFGGARPRSYDCSKPLTIGSLATDKTFILLNGRANGPYRDKVFAWLEEMATSIWGIYQKEVKSMLPDDVRSGAAMGEMVALPMVKELWKSLQNFRAAMGDEGALIVNLDGAMPDIPQANIPPDVTAKGKIPRLAYVNELKDRAKLAEAWSGLKTIITSAAAFAGAQTGVDIKTEPVTKKEGGVELYGFELPLNTGDVWPHTAVNGTHWFLSTSPSFTVELAGKTPAAIGPACGGHWQINFPALWNFAADWVKLLPIGPDETEMAGFGLSLARSIGALEVRFAEESGQSHDSFRFSIKDAE
jgi:hypothetical protein